MIIIQLVGVFMATAYLIEIAVPNHVDAHMEMAPQWSGEWISAGMTYLI